MHLRSSLAVCAIGATAFALPSFAADPLPAAVPLSIADQSGDANGLNSQGFLEASDPVSAPGQVTPGERTAADIVGVAFKRVDDGSTVSGTTISMTLAGAPDQGTLYRVQTASSAGCATFWVSVAWLPGGKLGNGTLTQDCAVAGTTVKSQIPVAVSGNTITWTLPVTTTGAAVGNTLSAIYGETRGAIGADGAASVTVPVIDETDYAKTKSYTIGQ